MRRLTVEIVLLVIALAAVEWLASTVSNTTTWVTRMVLVFVYISIRVALGLRNRTRSLHLPR